MKKLLVGIGSVAMALGLLVVVSSWSVSELFGYARAGADETIDGLEGQIPDSVRDRKLKNGIQQARGEIIDRRVKLNLAASEVRRMEAELSQLTASMKRREQILAEAYPALQTAAEEKAQPVSFAGTEWQPDELGAEIDKLLLEQERDEKQHAIRSEALARLKKSVADGAAAITAMEAKLLEAENEFETLIVRRDQAKNENDLLDLVSAAGSQTESASAQIGGGLDGLRDDVQELEARNDARRESGTETDGDSGRLTQAWDRLERLKRLHERRQKTADMSPSDEANVATDEQPEDTVPTVDEDSQPTSMSKNSADKDVVIIIKDATTQPQTTSETE